MGEDEKMKAFDDISATEIATYDVYEIIVRKESFTFVDEFGKEQVAVYYVFCSERPEGSTELVVGLN